MWKTTDAGSNWTPVSGQLLATSSVGARAQCYADPDVVWAGMGEVQLRGNVIPGDGVYRSTDAGETWEHMGLGSPTGQQMVGRVRIDPDDCNRVYIAVMGDPFGPSSMRGVFRTTDGGESWENVLFVSDRAGAVDLALDPNDPRTLYAGAWEAYRTDWSLESGGPGGGLHKSIDGGDTWTELSGNPGLPTGTWGKVGVSVSGASSDRVYAIIEAEDGGVFTSADVGATWERVSEDRNLRQRAFYYTRINADPEVEDRVYVLNVQFWRSEDGGRTWNDVDVPHGDNHDLSIAPDDSHRMTRLQVLFNDDLADLKRPPARAGVRSHRGAVPGASHHLLRVRAGEPPLHIGDAGEARGPAGQRLTLGSQPATLYFSIHWNMRTMEGQMRPLDAAKQELLGQFARIGKAVSSPARLELLDLLAQGEKPVELLARQAGLSVTNTSNHLKELRNAALVTSRKEGVHVHYRLADPAVREFLRHLQDIAAGQLAEARQIVHDYFREPDSLEPLGLSELLDRLKSDEVVVLDVRPEDEYASGHVPGALSIPAAELERRLGELPRGREVVAYCRGPYCVLALEAVEVLRSHGFRARRMDVGLPEWRAEGLAVIEGPIPRG